MKIGKGRRFSDTRLNAYATAVMAFLTLCALGMSYVQMHSNQRQRVRELELTRVQNELTEVKRVCFDLIDNGIYEYVLDLNDNMMYYDDFEVCKKRLDVLISGIETKCNRYVMTISPFDIPTCVGEGLDVYVICNNMMQTLMELHSCMNFFELVEREGDRGRRVELVKGYMDRVKLSPVRVKYDGELNEVEEEYEVTFGDYCRGCGYDFEKIKLYMYVYLGSTLDDVFGEKVALYDYVSKVWEGEVNKLNGVYERLEMRPVVEDEVE